MRNQKKAYLKILVYFFASSLRCTRMRTYTHIYKYEAIGLFIYMGICSFLQNVVSFIGLFCKGDP